MESGIDVASQQPERADQKSSSLGRAMNRFGAAFGAVVLVGGLVLYVADRPSATPVVEPDQEVPVATETTDGHVAEPHEDGDGEVAEEPTVPVVGVAVDGVIEVDMVEFGYLPAEIDIQAGVPVTLRFTNSGRLTHEAMVGDAHMQEEFADAGDHDDAGGDHHGNLMAVTVAPGQSADLELLIDEPGTWYFACHIPGHFEEGQVATINVTS